MSDKNDIKINVSVDAKGVKPGTQEAGREIDELTGKVNGLPPAYNKAAAATETFTNKGAALASAVGLVSTGVLAVGAAALAYTAHLAIAGVNTVKLANEMANLSDRTGMTVEHLSSMRFVLEQNNATVNDYATGMKTLSSRIYDAANGNKTALASFQALGISQQFLQDNINNGDAVFMKLADRFSEIKEGAGKNALANDVLGRSYEALLPTLNSGSEGIRQLAEEGEKWGQISREMAEKSKQLGDNWAALKFYAQGVGVSVANYFLPALVDITREARAAANESGLLNGVITALGVTFGKVFGLKSTRLEFADEKAKELFNQVTEAQTALDKLASIKGKSTGKDPDWLAGEMDKAAARVANLKKELKDTISERDNLLIKPVEAPKMDAPYKPEKQSDGIDQYQKKLTSLLDTLENRADTVSQKFWNDLEMLDKAYSSGKIGLDRYRMAVETLIDKTEYAKNLKKEDAAALKFQEEGVKRLAAEEKKRNDELTKSVAHDQAALVAMTRKNDLLERGIESVAGMAVAEAEAELASVDYTDATWEQIDALEKKLDISKQIEIQAKRGEHLKAMKDEAKEAQKAYEKMNDEINRGLTDALMRGWESGKGFAENAIDTIKNMFKTLILRPTISAVLSPVSGAISAGMGSLGIPGTSNAAGIGNTLSTANSAYSLYSSAMMPGGAVAGAGLYSAGSAIGSVSMMGYGAGIEAASLGAVGSGGASVIGAVGAEGSAAFAAGSGAAGTGLTGALAAVPVWGWVAAAAALMFMADDEPTPPSGLLATLKTDPANLPNFRYDRKSGAFSDGAYAESAFGQIGATEAFAYSGESAQKYLDMVASLDNTLATYLSPEAITRVSTELQAKTYGSEGEGWLETALPNMIKDRFTATFAEVNPELTAFLDSFSGTSEEIIAFGGSLLEVDKSLQDTSASTRLFGEVLDWVKIEDAARSGENVVQTFQRLSAEFALTNQIADMMGHDASTAFGSVGLASESARAALISAAGGLDALAAKTTSFFNKYYSDAERQQASARYSLAVVNDGFANMGLTVPSTMAEFRNLAEAQDLSTEAGRSTYLALMDLADAFATVSAAGGAAAVGLGQAANAIITANQSIGGNYVNNNNLAIGQAANAPIYDQALKEVNARSAALVSGTQVQFGTATDPKLNQEVAGWLAGYRTGGYMTPSAEQTQILRNLSLIPAHASGGLADRGWALVGEEGPELVNFSDPGRVYTADQTRAVFSANDEWDYRQTSGASAINIAPLLEELKQLRAKVEELAEAQYVTARNTRDTAKHMERWDSDGMPEVRAA
ncbi:MAG: hypothetical protein K8H84_03310 [Sulfuricella denitrificans]|nr:hypothetical protein [Sulfuricella denitrificans]